MFDLSPLHHVLNWQVFFIYSFYYWYVFARFRS